MSSGRRKKTVLILGGWSPGPLPYLRDAFRDECTFLEAPIHMPPAGFNWCLTWECGGLCATLALAGWMLGTAAGWGIGVGLLLLLLGPLVWTVLLVRGSIRRSVRAARRVVEAGGVDLVVGFSWGGGAACWLLESGAWSGPTLLLAPTVFAMSSAAGRSRPRLCCGTAAGGRRGALRVIVYQPTVDPFCPSGQVEYFGKNGADARQVRDSHVLDGPRTLEALCGSFAELLELADSD